jgi:hypothetical protein
MLLRDAVVAYQKNYAGKDPSQAIAKSVLLMNELGLTPKGRLPLKPAPSPKFQKFMCGPKS